MEIRKIYTGPSRLALLLGGLAVFCLFLVIQWIYD